MPAEERRWRILIAVVAISFASLGLEILLTRIFSVTLFYHYAFMVVSMSMLGIAVGGLWVYLRPPIAPDSTELLARASVGFALSSAAAIVFHLFLPPAGLPSAIYLFLNFSAFAVPFAFVGAFLSQVFRAYRSRIGTLYAGDLLGAGAGAASAALVLGPLDAPSAVLAFALVGVVPALVLGRHWAVAGLSAALLLAALMTNVSEGWLRPHWVKGEQVEATIAEFDRWNAYSHVRVLAGGRRGHPGWAVRPEDGIPKMRYRQLDIDAGAGTWIIGAGLNSHSLDFLQYDLSNLLYRLRPPRNALVIGVGGGRDLLSALHFGAEHATGVEINPIFERLLEGPYFEYSGRLLADPRLELVVDDGRAYLEASGERFDSIQLSLVDTWAASAAGAFVLTENSLYTVEAFRTYLEHLEADGYLSIARHSYYPPSQLLRVVTTAKAAAAELGMVLFEDHVIVARTSRTKWSDDRDMGTGVVIVKRAAYSPGEVQRAREIVAGLGMEVVYAPDMASPETPIAKVFHRFVTASDVDDLTSDYAYDVRPSTDDRPFFFHMVYLSDVVSAWLGFARLDQSGPTQSVNFEAVAVLFRLLVLVTLLTGLVIGVPLLRERRRLAVSGSASMDDIGLELLYFAGIGVGFMMVEVPLLQRFSVYLGHPILSLSVVLASLLIYCGIGSLLVGRLPDAPLRRAGGRILGGIVLLVLVAGPLLGFILSQSRALPIAGRAAVTVSLLAPLAIPLGMAFPLGVRLLDSGGGDRIPWYWGVNGACSVLGSATVMGIALFFGFTAALVLGSACYAVAWLALVRRGRGRSRATPLSG